MSWSAGPVIVRAAGHVDADALKLLLRLLQEAFEVMRIVAENSPACVGTKRKADSIVSPPAISSSIPHLEGVVVARHRDCQLGLSRVGEVEGLQVLLAHLHLAEVQLVTGSVRSGRGVCTVTGSNTHFVWVMGNEMGMSAMGMDQPVRGARCRRPG